jgi:hypothetical protein
MRKLAPLKGTFITPHRAAEILQKRVYATFEIPKVVCHLRKIEKSRSIGFGPWNETCRRLIRAAAVGGQIPLYFAPRNEDFANVRQVPVELVQKIVPVHGGLPDEPTRVFGESKLTKEGSLTAYNLQRSTLWLSVAEFEVWYRREKSKGVFPSQHSRKLPKKGRPKIGHVSNAIIAIVNRGEWAAETHKVADLTQLLEKRFAECPSEATIRRRIDEIFHLTGDKRFLRSKRRSVKKTAFKLR